MCKTTDGSVTDAFWKTVCDVDTLFLDTFFLNIHIYAAELSGRT